MMLATFAFAQTEPPQFVTVDGRLYDSTTPTNPLLDASVALRIQVLNPAKTCILYEEQQAVNTLAANGYFNVRVGSPTSGADSLKRSSNDSGNTMMTVFQNQNSAITGKTSSGIGCSYTPSSGDARYFRFVVTPSTTGVTTQLSPDMTIDSVPQALVAESLQGLSTNDFVQISANVTQAKLESLLGTSYATLTGLLAGTSSLYLQNTVNGTVMPSRPTNPAAPVAGQIWYDSDDFVLRYYDGTSVMTLGTSGGDPTKLPLAGGTMTGAIAMGSNDITGVGHITQSAQRTLRLGGYTGGQQTTLTGTLGAGHEGTSWYNTTTDKLMYWDGVASQEVLTTASANSLVPNCTATQSLQMSAGPVYVWSCVATTDSSKLPLAGGTMTGSINMGSNDITSVGHVTLSAQRTLRLGRYTTAQETTLVGTLIAGQEGTTWYNTTTNKYMYWDGTAARDVVNSTQLTGFGDITDVVAGNGLTGGAASGSATLDIGAGAGISVAADAISVDITGTTAETVPAAGDELLIYDASATALRKMTRSNFLTGYLTSEVDTLATVTGRGANTSTNITMDARAEVRLADTAGGEYAALKAPATIATNYVLTLPTTAGSNGQVLQTDGTGVLSWIAIPSAPVSSVFGRTGAVVSANGDYTASQVTNVAAGTIMATDVQGALNELDTEKVAKAGDTMTGQLTMTNNITLNAQNQVRYADAAGGEYAAIQAPTMIATNYVLTLPDTAGSAGQVLQTNGSGVLSWVSGGSLISADSLNFTEFADAMTLDASTDIAATGTNVLSITNSGTGNSFVVNDQASDTSPFVVDAAGNVGIGTTTPTEKLEVVGRVRTSGVALEAGGSNVGSLDFRSLSLYDFTTAGATSVPTISLRGSRITGTSADGDTLARLDFIGNKGGYVQEQAAGVAAQVDGVVGANLPGRLTFSTNSIAGAYTERLRIDSSGKVGIGTITPTTLLDIAGAITSRPNGTASGETGQLIMRELAASPGGTDTVTIRAPDSVGTSFALTLPDTAGSSGQVLQTNGSGVLSWVTAGAASIANDSLDFDKFADAMTLDASTDISVGANILSVTNDGAGSSFVVNDNGAADATPFIVSASGNVGIGTTSALTKLHVSASGRPLLVNSTDSSLIKQVWYDNGSATGFGIGGSAAVPFAISDGLDTNRLFTILSSGNVGVGTSTPGTRVDVAGAITSRPFGTATGETGQLIMRELAASPGGTDTVTIRAPDSVGTSFALTLPDTAGSSGQVLQTNGSGVLSWVSGGSLISADSLNFTDFSDTMTLDASTDISATGTNVLSITNSGTGNSFVVNDQASDTTPFVIDQSGNVGIGTTAPTAGIDVSNGVMIRSGNINSVGDFNIARNGSVRFTFWGGYTQLSGFLQNTNSGGISIGSGNSAANPSYSFSSDNNSGMYSPVAQQLGFSTNSQERLRIDASGNIGVGTTVPGTRFDVAGAITSRPSGIGTGQTGQLVMRELAASPGGTDTVTIRAPDSVGTSFALTLPDTAGASGQILSTDGTGILSWITPAAGVAADSLNFTDFSDTMTLDASTDIAVTGTNVLSITNSGTGNSFVVNDQSSDTTPFVIDASGNVGIGTTAPAGPLHSVADTVTGNGTSGAAYFGSSSQPAKRIYLGYDVTPNAGIIQVDQYAVGPRPLALNPSGGNVGVGTTAPGTLLDIAGAITSRPSGTGTGQTGQLIMRELAASPGGTDTVTIRAPDSVGTSFALTLPGTAGSNGQVLSTDGTGILSWITPAAGVAADSLDFTDFSDTMTLDASTDIAATGTNVLSITNSGTGNSFRVNDQASDTTPFVIDQSGNVGIGTTAPASALQISNNSTASSPAELLNGTWFTGGTSTTTKPHLLLEPSGTASTTWGTNGTAIGINAANGFTGNLLDFKVNDVSFFTMSAFGGFTTLGNATFRANNPSITMGPSLTQNAVNDVLTDILTRGTNSAWSTYDAARFRVVATNVGAGTEASTMSFQTVAAGAMADRITIVSNNVGIGTTIPSTLLDIAGAITSRPNGTGTGQTGQIMLRELAASPGGTDTVTIRAPDSVGTSFALTLPDTAGSSGQVLQTNGSGVLSWVSGGSLISADSLNFTEFADALVLDASTDIAATGTNVLSITNSGTGNSFVVNDQTSDTSPFVVDAAGNVGIGTTAASTPLEIAIPATNAVVDMLTIQNPFAGSWSGSAIRFRGNSGDSMGNIFAQYDGNTINSSFHFTTRIANADRATFKIRYDGAIFSGGDIGYTEGGRIHSNSDTAAGNSVAEGLTLLHMDNNSAGSNGIGNRIRFTTETTTNGLYKTSAFIDSVMDDADDTTKDGSLRFSTIGPNAGAGVTVPTEKVRIDSSGNVGVGTTIPSTLLDIAGAITSRPNGTGTGQTGQIMLRELAASPGGTDTVTIRAPDSVGTSFALTLPDTAGSSGQVLQTNGSGVLSWVTPAAGVAADSLNFTDFSDTMSLDASTDIAVTGTNVLSITNSGTGNSFVVNDQASDTTPFVVDAAGNVGIGTSAPSAAIDIGQRNVAVRAISGLASEQISIDIGRTTADAQFAVAGASGHFALGSISGDAVFRTINSNKMLFDTSGGTTTPVLTLGASNGNVGIRTTSPGAMLQLGTAGTSLGTMRLTGSTSGFVQIQPAAAAGSWTMTLPGTAGSSGQVLQTDGAGVSSWATLGASSLTDDSLNFDKFSDTMSLDASTDIAVTGANILSITNTGTANSFVVADQASDTSPFVIDPSGNVGIGTTTPGSKLEVSGRIVSSLTSDADALTALTVDFSNSNVIDATGASAACGTLNITNTANGGSFTLTIPNATATCTTIQWNGSATNVKLPAGYAGGVATSGLVYSFLHSGSFLWVTNVTY